MAADALSRATEARVPWVLPASLVASTCIVVGLIWDISWHRTVGRDTFWTYPHVLEQLAAIIAGLGCGWLVLRTTFAGPESARASSVRFWGFRGPLGAWVSIWGTIMMITSAPFDNWWHNAYGLDVKIISPPHMVLAWGMIAIQVGAVLLAYAAQNRGEQRDTRLALMAAYSGAIIVTMLATVIMEHAAFANEMHGSVFYQITGALFPFVLVTFARPSHLRWPATTIAVIYSVVELIMVWVLPLFSAVPKLAPIYNPVTHMVPPVFPLLLVVPAIAIDLVLRRRAGRAQTRPQRDWVVALVIGVLFTALFFAVQWTFAEFLMSSAARNAIFAANEWDYNIKPGAWQYQYWNLDRDASGQFSPMLLAQGMLIATGITVLSARFGLACGKALTRVKR
jgi:hypothetical protein